MKFVKKVESVSKTINSETVQNEKYLKTKLKSYHGKINNFLQ